MSKLGILEYVKKLDDKKIDICDPWRYGKLGYRVRNSHSCCQW